MHQLKGTPTQGLIGATLSFFLGLAAVSLFGPTVKAFAGVVQMSPLMIGLLVAMPALSGSLIRIPFGAWGDSAGGRKPILISLVLSLIGIVGLLVVVMTLYPKGLTAAYYPLLLVLGLLGGCGIGGFAAGIGQVSYWFPQSKQGSALGMFGGLGNLAPGIFAFLLPISLANFGLSFSYLAWVVFLAIGIIVYYLIGANSYYFQLKAKGVDSEKAKMVAMEHGQTIFPKGTARQSLANAARVWKTWVLVGIYFTSFGGFLALTSWFPTYWMGFYKTDLIAAGMLTGSFSILTSLVRVGGGNLSDRFGGEKMAITAILIMALGSAMLSVSNIFVLSLAGAMVMAVGMGITNAAVFKIVPLEIKGAVGGAAGWIGGLGAFGGFAIPPIMAVFVSSVGLGGYAIGFMTFVGLSLLSLALIYVMRLARVRVAPAAEAETRLSMV